MRKNFRGLFIGLCVMSAVSMTACSDKNQNNVTEIESTEKESTQSDNSQSNTQNDNTQNNNQLMKNVKVGISNHLLIAEIPAEIDYGTGEFADGIINYQSVGQAYYIGPKDYLALDEDKIVIYDRGGEQVVFWNMPGGNKFYSVEGLNVERLYYDGEDVLLKCRDGNYYPIKEDGTISKSAKKDVKIDSIATDEFEEMVQGEDKFLNVIKVDEDGCFYTHERAFKDDVVYFEHRICKYDKNGKLLGYSLYYTDDFVAEPDYPVIVSEDGSIYRMACEKNVIKIYRLTLGTADYYRLDSKLQAYKDKMTLEDERLVGFSYYAKGNTHEAIRDVLIRNKEFIDTDNGGKKTTIDNFYLNDGTAYDEDYFSVADVDKDGYYEVFVRQHSDIYVVFKYIQGEVYSYQISSDKFLNNDGIMFDRGVYFVPEFTVDGYTRCDLAHSEKTDDGDKFYIGGKLVEYDEYVRYIGAKDNWKIAKKFYGASELDYFAKVEKNDDKDYMEKYITDYTDESVVPKEIVDVLLYDKEFRYTYDTYSEDYELTRITKVIKVSDLGKYDKLRRVKNYVVVDIDKDGYNEVVAYMQYPRDDVIVFHSENGVVYGYEFVFRAAQWIAPGGYLHGSSGAADNDTYTLVFNKDNYTQIEKCGTESDGTYYVDEVEVSREEYSKVYDEVWGKGKMQEYESLLMLLEMVDKE